MLLTMHATITLADKFHKNTGIEQICAAVNLIQLTRVILL